MRSGASVWRSRSFVLMWSATIASSSGTVLGILALSIAVYEQTRSNLAASMVPAAQWFMPLVLAPLLATLCVRHAPRTLILLAEGVSIPLTVGLGLLAQSTPVGAAILLLARSFVDSVTKTATPIAVKRGLPDAQVTRAVASCEAARLYGAVVGALAGTVLLSRLALTEIMLVNAAGFVVSVSLFAAAALPTAVVRRPGGPPRGLTMLRTGMLTVLADPLMLRAFLLVASTTIPQALHNIGRTALSVEHLGLGASGVSLLATVTTLALGSGAFLASVASSGPARSPWATWVLVLLPPLLLCTASVVAGVGLSFASYGSYVVLFEVGFVWFTATLIDRCPRAAIEEIAALRSVLLPGVLFVSLGVFGLLVDLIGLFGGGVGYLLVAVVVGLSQARLHRRAATREGELVAVRTAE